MAFFSSARPNSSLRLYFGFLALMLLFSISILTASALMGDSPDLIVSDGNGYYAWLRSLMIDGDLDFRNDFAELYFPDLPPPELSQQTPLGLVPNKYPIGLAIAELPGFLIGHLIANLTAFPTDGISLPYQLAVSISLVVIILGAAYAFLWTLVEPLQIRPAIALPLGVMALVGSNMLHYIAKEPTMAHGLGAALLSGIVYLAYARPGFERRPMISRFGAGAIIGLLLITRFSNVVFVPFILVLFAQEFMNPYRRRRRLGVFTLGVGLMLVGQQLALFSLWGRFFVNSYAGEVFDGGLSGLVNILIGQSYGLFLYHPWYLILLLFNVLSLLVLGFWKTGPYRWLPGSIFLAAFGLWFLNGLWGFEGDSFGCRAFIELLPPLSLGAALALQYCVPSQKWLINWQSLVLVALLGGLNLHLWLGYLLQRYPHNAGRTLLQAYFWPTGWK